MTKKHKILMISDHPLSVSGVGTQSRYLINGLIATGKYSFFCFGAAMKHTDYNVTTVNEDFIIKPIDGFGDMNLMRTALLQVKPDAVLLFTDPRFFHYIWSGAENEIHQVCPIAYNTIWDNGPTPRFNDAVYESCDLLNCINYPTYEMLSENFSHMTNYVPHAVPNDLYYPMSPDEATKMKKQLLGANRADHLVGLFVSRNARRKMPSDVITSWKLFLDDLEKKHGHRNATLLMHTDPNDQEGPNLHAVTEMLGMQDNVMFSKERTGFHEMRTLYNIADFIITASAAEGFGLSLLEAKMCGKIGVSIKTGGLTRQIEDHETGEQYGVALTPEVKTLVGTQQIPYIYEDLCSWKTYSDAFMRVFEMGPEKRRELGFKAMQHAHKNYDMNNLITTWDTTLSNMIDGWKSGTLPNNKKWSVTTI